MYLRRQRIISESGKFSHVQTSHRAGACCARCDVRLPRNCPATAGNQRGDTGHVSARLGKAGGKTQTDGIADEEHDNRYVRGRVLCSKRSLSSDDNDEIGFRLHEIGGERRKLVEAMGADLKLETRAGWGSRFYFDVELPPASHL